MAWAQFILRKNKLKIIVDQARRVKPSNRILQFTKHFELWKEFFENKENIWNILCSEIISSFLKKFETSFKNYFTIWIKYLLTFDFVGIYYVMFQKLFVVTDLTSGISKASLALSGAVVQLISNLRAFSVANSWFEPQKVLVKRFHLASRACGSFWKFHVYTLQHSYVHT